MILPILGLALGVAIGFISTITFPQAYSPYVAVFILACMDSVFGGIHADFNKSFQLDIFISGFLANAALAMALTWLGTQLNMQLSIAVIVVYGARLFENFARIRRFLLNKTEKKDNIYM